jgi:predicted GNAT family acetyltransferase
MHAASYHRDFDYVAIASDGSLAAYVGAPYDEANRCGIIEPVCTHPDHLRRGLAHTLTLEALHGFQKIGATDVILGTGDREAANRLYEAAGFTEAYRGYYWRKIW